MLLCMSSDAQIDWRNFAMSQGWTEESLLLLVGIENRRRSHRQQDRRARSASSYEYLLDKVTYFYGLLFVHQLRKSIVLFRTTWG